MSAKSVAAARALESVAYHEAGHAVMCVRLKRGFRSVSVVPEDDSLGRVMFVPLKAGLDPFAVDGAKLERLIERELLTTLCGMSAERRFVGRRNWRGGRSDISRALDLAERLYQPEVAGKYIDFMIARADGLIMAPIVWVQIEAVAGALLAHRTLSSAAVRRICFHAMSDGKRVRELAAEFQSREFAESDALLQEVCRP
jgi:hypothetical protein